MKLEDSTKLNTGKCISLPVIFNNIAAEGCYLTASNAGCYIRLPRNISYYPGSYLHLDLEKFEEMYGEKGHYANERPFAIETIKKLCILQAAGMLKVDTGLWVLKRRTFKVGFLPVKQILTGWFWCNTFEWFFEGKPWYKKIVFQKPKLWKYESVEVKTDLDCPPFGGTWQTFFTKEEVKEDWIKEAEAIKGSTIYLT